MNFISLAEYFSIALFLLALLLTLLAGFFARSKKYVGVQTLTFYIYVLGVAIWILFVLLDIAKLDKKTFQNIEYGKLFLFSLTFFFSVLFGYLWVKSNKLIWLSLFLLSVIFYSIIFYSGNLW